MERMSVVGVLFGSNNDELLIDLDSWAKSLDEMELTGGISLGMVLGKPLQLSLGEEDLRVKRILTISFGTLPHEYISRGNKLPAPTAIQQGLASWCRMLQDESSIIATRSPSEDLDLMLTLLREARRKGDQLPGQDLAALDLVCSVTADVLRKRQYLPDPGSPTA